LAFDFQNPWPWKQIWRLLHCINSNFHCKHNKISKLKKPNLQFCFTTFFYDSKVFWNFNMFFYHHCMVTQHYFQLEKFKSSKFYFIASWMRYIAWGLHALLDVLAFRHYKVSKHTLANTIPSLLVDGPISKFF